MSIRPERGPGGGGPSYARPHAGPGGGDPGTHPTLRSPAPLRCRSRPHPSPRWRPRGCTPFQSPPQPCSAPFNPMQPGPGLCQCPPCLPQGPRPQGEASLPRKQQDFRPSHCLCLHSAHLCPFLATAVLVLTEQPFLQGQVGGPKELGLSVWPPSSTAGWDVPHH